MIRRVSEKERASEQASEGKGEAGVRSLLALIPPPVLQWRMLGDGGALLPTPCPSEVQSVKLSRSNCIISVESL